MSKEKTAFTPHHFFKRNNVGFTLIELLVVIAIIGTLSGAVFTSLRTVRRRSRDIKRQSEMRQLISGLSMYYNEQEKYLTQAEKTDGTPQIGEYLPAMDDPLCLNGPCTGGYPNYKWKGNTGGLDCDGTELDAVADEWFCSYAKLEDEVYCAVNEDAYSASSHKGVRIACVTQGTEPTITSGCSCFEEPSGGPM